MSQYLYELVNRVPPITDEQIAEYRKIKGIKNRDPRDVSCIACAEPTGPQLMPACVLGTSQIITQHHSGTCFVPSLAEVYAWIRIYFGDNWRRVKYFCLDEANRVGASTDCWCRCTVIEELIPVPREAY